MRRRMFVAAAVVIALGGLAAVSWVSYAMSKRVGRPIEELLSYIKVNKFGKTAEKEGVFESDYPAYFNKNTNG